MSKKRILIIFGTRPEAIKFAPLIKEFENYEIFDLKVCVTGQHYEMLYQVLDFFNIKPDFNFNLMKKNQTLFHITINVLSNMDKLIDKINPKMIFVQGDTTTAFIAALSAFYKKIRVAHLEAGLRSYNKYSPFPEEINRVLIGHLADYHFVPTERAKENLYKENIKENVYVVGNTVIDALLLGLDIIKREKEEKYYKYFDFIDFSKKIILVTGHRRESFGKPFENICLALKEISDNFNDIEIVYPVHLNPNVREPVNKILKDQKNIHLIEPLEYPYLIWLMNKSYLVLTDSGGIQEEAPSLGKPVLVMREVTERIEGIQAGTAKLVGTDKNTIINEVKDLLENHNEYKKMANAVNPYGDGKASKRIVKCMLKKLDF